MITLTRHYILYLHKRESVYLAREKFVIFIKVKYRPI